MDSNLLGYDGGDAHPGMCRMMAYMRQGFTDVNINQAPGPDMVKWEKAAGALDVKEGIISFNMGKLAATESDQLNITANLANMIDSFATIGSSTHFAF